VLRWRTAVLLASAIGALLVYRCLQPPDAFRAPSAGDRSVVAVAEGWPIAGGDAGATGSLAAEPRFDFDQAWQRQLDAPVVAPLVTDGSTLLVALADGRLVALSAEDGSERWSVAIPGQLDHAPTIAGDAAYVGLRGGAISALDLATATERWSYASGTTFATSPVVVDGVAWVGAQGRLLALDAETGALLGERSLGPLHVGGRPAVGDGLVVVATRRGEVQRGSWFGRAPGVIFFDQRSGRERFRAPVVNATHVAIGSGTVVVASAGGLVAFEPSSRSPWWERARNVWAQFRLWGLAPSPPGPPFRWSVRMPCEPLAPVIAGTRVIAACANGEVRAYTVTNGGPIWVWQGAELARAPLASPAGILLVEQDGFRLLDAASGRERAYARMDDVEAIEQLMATEGGIYLVTADGRLVSLR